MAASLGVGVSVVAAFPILLVKLGFTATGSIAAWIQATFLGGVIVPGRRVRFLLWVVLNIGLFLGGFFATLQSWGAAGIGYFTQLGLFSTSGFATFLATYRCKCKCIIP